jgi:type IV pilus assembly protein PilQ
VTVESVRVSAESVYITTDKPVKYKVFSVGQPPKLVVELEDARLKTLEEIPVNGTFIAKVRTGQYKTSPVSVARIVLELTQKSVYDITQKGNELVVVMGGKFDNNQSVQNGAQSAADVKVIAPSPKSPAPAAPLAVKPSNLSRASAPAIAPGKTAAPSGRGSRDIMASLPTELINLDYPEVEIRDLIGMLAAKAGINVIYTTDVTGTTAINLSKVPFDEAFRIILNVNGLAAQQVGDNILRIAAPQTFLAEQKKAYQQTRVFFLSYTQAAEAKTQVTAVAAAEGRAVNCSVDAANNALIVTDSAAGLEGIARLIKSLDRVPKQVMIEVKLLEVSLDSEFSLGIQWDANATTPNAALPGGALPLTIADHSQTNIHGGFTAPALAANYGTLVIGKLMGNSQINATISAAAKKGKVKVLSDPKVATVNNKEASINITDQIPYDQQTVTIVNGQNSIAHAYSNVTTGITLKVTPSINSDGRIAMHLIPAVIQLSGVPNGVAPPPTATRETNTNVIVRNGETIVIGGLIQDSQSETVYKVPLLGDIPVLGWLFKKKSMSRTRKELLIFVTPRILED